MNSLAYQIGFEDGESSWECLPFEGWYKTQDILEYLKGFYAGKKIRLTKGEK
mgnify:FL=1